MSDNVNKKSSGSGKGVVHGPVRVIAVTSGKGGVGKTNVSVNLSVAMAGLGKRVMLLDADLGLANVDVVLGLHSRSNLSHVINGECGLDDVIVEGPRGIQVIPASSGVSRMARLSTMEYAGLIGAFSNLDTPLDTLIVDTPAGIADDVLSFSRAAQEVVVVVCDEPASMTDAYALIKVLNREQGIGRFHILANRVVGDVDGNALFRRMAAVCTKFLDVTLHYLGSVPEDTYLRRAVQRQGAVVELYPGSQAGKAFRKIANVVDGWPGRQGPSGHLEFFLDRVVKHKSNDHALWTD